jgi:hypothetical protein
MKKSFKHWTQDEISLTFGITKVQKLPALEQWLEDSKLLAVSDIESQKLFALQQYAIDFFDTWNETELREKFVIKLLDSVNFDEIKHQFNSFAERYLSATIGKHTLYGFVDWMVATGVREPRHPYFFMHEFKQEENAGKDGRGQLLAILLATQRLNQDGQPVFGCFILGRFWFFMALEGNEYAISSSFDVEKNHELLAILKILKQQKEMILERIKK